jgi:GWxTD domain-containing protein
MARVAVFDNRYYLAVTFAVTGLLLFGSAIATQAAAAADLPTVPAVAMAIYEGNIDGWMKGPVEYIVLDEEREIWNELETTEERRAFIHWFWMRRDDDLRVHGNPFKEAFYARVAEANDRFSDFPRGWRSDRGRVFVTLGRPDSIRGVFGRAASGTIWTYYTNGRDHGYVVPYGEMTVAFGQEGTLYEIAGGMGGRGSYPFYLLRAFEYANEAAITDGSLEFSPKA